MEKPLANFPFMTECEILRKVSGQNKSSQKSADAFPEMTGYVCPLPRVRREECDGAGGRGSRGTAGVADRRLAGLATKETMCWARSPLGR